MIMRWLFGTKDKDAAARAAARPAVPAGLRVYAIGDIHGRLDLLEDLHAQIRRDLAVGAPLQAVLVYLGDYVDRGLHSKEVVNLLINGPLPAGRAIFLKGNHEEAFLDFLGDPGFGMVWRNFGGLETLHSYGVPEAARLATVDQFLLAHRSLQESLPAAHLTFLRSLRLNVSFGDYFFAHAGVRPGVPLDRQSDEDLLWIRDQFLDSAEDFGKIVVHGHTPEAEPVIRANRIGIDTGAYMTGVLTALVLEGTTRRFLQARL